MTERRRVGTFVVAAVVSGASAAVATSVAGEAATGDGLASVNGTTSNGEPLDAIVIDLADDSRFEVAVAGTVQLPDDPPNPAGPTIPDPRREASTTTPGFGSTVDLADTPLTTATSLIEPKAGGGPASERWSVTFAGTETTAGRRGMAALESIDYPWREALDGWTVSFHGGRDDVSGLVHFDRREIELFVRTSHSDAQLARIMAHEIGHVVDWRHVDDTERQRWLEQRGLTGRAWYPSTGTNDFFSPAGDFAEAFAVWLLGGQSAARIGGPVTQADLDLMAQIGLPN